MRVDQLTGALLDLWVAKAVGVDAVMSDPYRDGSRSAVTFYGRDHDGRLDGRSYKPSEHWSDGGPLLDQFEVMIGRGRVDGPAGKANYATARMMDNDVKYRGDTALQAGMRAIVASVYGQEVHDSPPPQEA